MPTHKAPYGYFGIARQALSVYALPANGYGHWRQMGMATGGIDIIVLKKHGCRQNDVRIAGSFCKKLFMYNTKEIFTR